MRIVPLLTAAVVAAMFYIWISGPGTDAAENTPSTDSTLNVSDTAPVPVVVVKSVARPVDSAIVLRGRTEAFRKVDLRAEVTGQVVSTPLRAGTRVAEGDLMCEIDAGEKIAALDEAQARLMDAEMRKKASEQLVKRGFAAETKALTDKAALDAATYAVRRAEKEISRLRLTAPFEGLLETDTAEIGSLLQPGGLCGTIIALNPVKLVGFVPENQVDKVKVGSQAGAELSTGQRILGKITFVSSSADLLTRTFRVEVLADNPDNAIRDGLSAQIAVPISGVSGHLLPQAALTLDDAGRLGVRIVIEERAQFAPVTVIRDSTDGIWVTGLDETSTVIVVGQEFVSDGRPVAPTLAEESAI